MKLYVIFQSHQGSNRDNDVFMVSLKHPKKCPDDKEGFYWDSREAVMYVRRNEIREWLGYEIELPKECDEMICLVSEKVFSIFSSAKKEEGCQQ